MKKSIFTANAPAAIGPYSQGIAIDGFIFTSGQLPIDPTTGKFPSDDIKEQTRQSLNNVKAVLESVGSSMDKVIKTTVFLQNMSDFASMNEIYNSFFSDGNYPARSAFEVAALPMGAKVEIEVIAHK